MMTRRQWLRCGVGESKRWYPNGRDPDPRGCAPALPGYPVTAARPAGSTVVTLLPMRNGSIRLFHNRRGLLPVCVCDLCVSPLCLSAYTTRLA